MTSQPEINNQKYLKLKTVLIIGVIIILIVKYGQQHAPLSKYEKFLAQYQPDSIGLLISTIEFKRKANQEEKVTFENGIVPWVSINNPELEMLVNPDEIVLPFKTATIIIRYPLNNPVRFELLPNEKGFSRKQLIQEINRRYHEIYNEDEKTNGKYGIWGHDLSDLDLGTIEVHKRNDGKVFLILGIES
jgi:hypothetical protein